MSEANPLDRVVSHQSRQQGVGRTFKGDKVMSNYGECNHIMDYEGGECLECKVNQLTAENAVLREAIKRAMPVIESHTGYSATDRAKECKQALSNTNEKAEKMLKVVEAAKKVVLADYDEDKIFDEYMEIQSYWDELDSSVRDYLKEAE